MSRAATIAADLRTMADNLWDVEFRINVDTDAALLCEAASLLEATAAICASIKSGSTK